MPLFEVMTPRDSADPADIELVRDRFSWGAALVPPVWAILHGLWLALALWFAGLIVIGVVGLFAGDAVGYWLYALFALWYGFAASDLRVGALRREGYVAAGPRIAADQLLAERDFLEERLK